MFRKTLTLALGLSLAAATLGAADSYTFGGRDAGHAEVAFKITHWVINKVRGTFNSFEGKINYDEKNIEKSSVEVSIDTDSIDTRNGMRDKHLKSPDFFDAVANPKITFKSTKVEKAKEGDGLLISGDLTMRGVTKPVVLDAKITGKMDDNMGNTRLGFTGSTKIKRTDFGIAWNKSNKTGTSMLGEEVEIELSGEASLKK